jgi:hypothetical protein
MSNSSVRIKYNELFLLSPREILETCNNNEYYSTCNNEQFWYQYVISNYDPHEYNLDKFTLDILKSKNIFSWKDFVYFTVDGTDVPVETNYPISLNVFKTNIFLLYDDPIDNIKLYCDDLANSVNKEVSKINIYGKIFNQELQMEQKYILKFMFSIGWTYGMYDIVNQEYLVFENGIIDPRNQIGQLFDIITSIDIYV